MPYIRVSISSLYKHKCREVECNHWIVVSQRTPSVLNSLIDILYIWALGQRIVGTVVHSECVLRCQQSCWVADDYAALRCWWLHWAGLELPPCCVPDVSFFLSLFHPLIFFSWGWAKLPQGTVGNYDWQPDAGRDRSCFKTSMGFHLVADTSSLYTHALALSLSLCAQAHICAQSTHIMALTLL